RPQVVNNTLFLLQTTKTDVTNLLQVTPTTAPATVTATPATATPALSEATATTTTTMTTQSGITTRVDPNIYGAPLDASIQGTLQAYSIETGAKLAPALGADGPISAPQAGGRFLIW